METSKPLWNGKTPSLAPASLPAHWAHHYMKVITQLSWGGKEPDIDSQQCRTQPTSPCRTGRDSARRDSEGSDQSRQQHLDKKVFIGSTVLEYRRWCEHAVRMTPRSKEKTMIHIKWDLNASIALADGGRGVRGSEKWAHWSGCIL